MFREYLGTIRLLSSLHADTAEVIPATLLSLFNSGPT